MWPSDFKERRAFSRYRVTIPATYKSLIIDEKAYAQTNDISVEGMGLLTERGLIPGNDLDICLQMVDNEEKIQLKGKIIWSKPTEPGLFRSGIKLLDQKMRPIRLVLRTIKAQRKY